MEAENINPKGGVAIGLIIHQETGEFIMVRNLHNKNPKAKIPGGRIEPGETPIEALVRELWEETGIVVEKDNTIPLFSVIAYNKKHYYHVFACSVPDFTGLHEEPVKDGEDLIESIVMNESQLSQSIVLKHHLVMLKQAINTLHS